MCEITAFFIMKENKEMVYFVLIFFKLFITEVKLLFKTRFFKISFLIKKKLNLS
jgi:hypothetical protein